MAVSKMLPQICVLFTALYSFVSSQQATAPGDPNSLFSNLLATSNSPGQIPTDPNTPSFGNPSMGANAGFGPPMGGQNMGFLGGASQGMPSRGYPMPPMGGMSSNAGPAPLSRPNMMQSFMPLAIMSGSDMMQRMAMMSMIGGGGAAAMGGGAGGMFQNPYLMLHLMNM